MFGIIFGKLFFILQEQKKKTEKIYLAGLFFNSKLRIYKAEDFVQPYLFVEKVRAPLFSENIL